MIAVMLTAAGALIALFLKEFFARLSTQRAMAFAVRAEVQALVDVVEARGYVKTLEGEIAKGEMGQHMFMPPVLITRDYFPVSGRAADKMGTLPAETAELVFRYYILANGFIEDATYDFGNRGIFAPDHVPQAKQTLHVLRQALEAGRQVIHMVDAEYPKSAGFNTRARAAWRRIRRECQL